jgi:hypothetical protein
LNIGCFGAVRPMKNQLTQAIAAIKFARLKNKKLRFYINATRTETGGEAVLKNIRSLFAAEPDAELIECVWYSHYDFLILLQSMDIGMQVSMSETFNVVSADYITVGLPVVVSPEIKWVTRLCQAKTESVEDIVRVMDRVWNPGPDIGFAQKILIRWNQWLLADFVKESKARWIKFAA